MSEQTLTSQQFKNLSKPKANKFHARKTVLDGETFDSQAEANRYATLKVRARAGLISRLERQPKFKLAIGDRPILIRSERYPNGRQASVKFDFSYFVGATRVIEDVKGGKATKTEAYTLRKAVVEAMFPGLEIVEVTA